MCKCNFCEFAWICLFEFDYDYMYLNEKCSEYLFIIFSYMLFLPCVIQTTYFIIYLLWLQIFFLMYYFTVSYVQFDAFIKLFLFKEKKEILIHYFKMIKITHYSKEFLFLLFCI